MASVLRQTSKKAFEKNSELETPNQSGSVGIIPKENMLSHNPLQHLLRLSPAAAAAAAVASQQLVVAFRFFP